MVPVTQSRTGARGTCFRASVASILELPESSVPDWPRTNEDPGVDRWLATRGLRYARVPIGDAPPPVGYHIIEGVSPRGGQHAVVGLDGRVVWDPHPRDGTGRGLVKPERWGLLLPVVAGQRTEARDGGVDVVIATRAGKSVIYELHKPNCQHLHTLYPHGAAKTYPSVQTALAEWRAYYRRNEDSTPIVIAPCLRGKAKDEEPSLPHAPGDVIRLPNGRKTTVTKVRLGEDLFGNKEWHVSTKTGEVVVVRVKDNLPEQVAVGKDVTCRECGNLLTAVGPGSGLCTACAADLGESIADPIGAPANLHRALDAVLDGRK